MDQQYSGVAEEIDNGTLHGLARLAAPWAHAMGDAENLGDSIQLLVQVDYEPWGTCPRQAEMEGCLQRACQFLSLGWIPGATLSAETPVGVWPDWPRAEPLATVPLGHLQYWEGVTLVCALGDLRRDNFTGRNDTSHAHLLAAIGAVNSLPASDLTVSPMTRGE